MMISQFTSTLIFGRYPLLLMINCYTNIKQDIVMVDLKTIL